MTLNRFLSLCLILILVGTIWATPPTTVDRVDLSRYLGTWYEVARLPNPFEPVDATQIMATYSQNSDGFIRVENQYTRKGKIDKVTGVARIEDRKSNAKLAVSFFDILGYRPIWGDYWILGIGPNYTYSVVGDRARKYAWILSRTSEMSSQNMAAAVGILKQNGYDTQPLIYPKNGDRRD
ncbi:hypothetical protein EBR57_08270 [bacterium]|nr:hypothetical protein [bacterium]